MNNDYLQRLLDNFGIFYNWLYDHTEELETVERALCDSFDFQLKHGNIKPTLQAFCEIRRDIVSSDRECAAFMLALSNTN